jgi:hypothetical protein
VSQSFSNYSDGPEPFAFEGDRWTDELEFSFRQFQIETRLESLRRRVPLQRTMEGREALERQIRHAETNLAALLLSK